MGTSVLFCIRLLRIPLLSTIAVGDPASETPVVPPTVPGLSPPLFSILAAVGNGPGAVPFVLLAVGGRNTDGAADGAALGDLVGAADGRLVYERSSVRSTNWHVASRLMDNQNPTKE